MVTFYMIFLIVISVAVFVVTFYRTGLLDLNNEGAIMNNVLFLYSFVSYPCLIIMSAIPTSSPQGAIHLVFAMLGLGTLVIYLVSLHIYSFYLAKTRMSLDQIMPPVLRYLCYGFTILSATLGFILCAIWVTNTDNTPFEWAGVFMIFIAILPYYILFIYAARRRKMAYSQIQ